MSVILIGFMGAGKSSVARLLDENFSDSDEWIVQRVGQPIADYVAQNGSAKFRRREEEVLADLVNSTSAKVIATGGGIVESLKNQKILELQNRVVYLQADFDSLLERIRNDKENQRFVFENSNLADFRKIYLRRLPIYERLSDLTIDTAALSPQEVAKIISEKFPI